MTYWLPLASAANIGQAGAALAVAIKTRDVKIRSLALPSSLSAFMGITEPAIFGVNLRFFKPFVAGCIGGGLGAMFASIVGLAASGTGVTGIFGILLCLNQPVQYIIMFAIAGLVSFGISFMLYRDPEDAPAASQPAPAVEAPSAPASREPEPTASDAGAPAAAAASTLVSPLSGTAIAMTEVSDPVFASECMGRGIAIIPDEGTLYAPADGTVIVLADTGHAVGMKTDAGTEVLMHIGIDTVSLEGKPFRARVKLGDHVTAGQPLMDIDLEYIRAQGLDTVTPVIVTNTADYASVEALADGPVKPGDPVVSVA